MTFSARCCREPHLYSISCNSRNAKRSFILQYFLNLVFTSKFYSTKTPLNTLHVITDAVRLTVGATSRAIREFKIFCLTDTADEP